LHPVALAGHKPDILSAITAPILLVGSYLVVRTRLKGGP
jgi:hypothetical protein